MANLKDFLLPDLGEGLTEGEIVSWLVAEGDTIELNQPVAEVETAKAVVEVPSPFAGRVTTLHAEVGEEVEVGKPLVTIDIDVAAGETAAGDVAAGETAAGDVAAGETAAGDVAAGETAAGDVEGGEVASPDEVTPAAAPTPGGEPGDTPADAAAAEMVPETDDEDDDGGASGSVLVGYGTGGGARARRRRGASAPAATTGPAAGAPPARPKREGRPLAKPPVRRLAKDLGIDLALVEGSGPEGVITREDVERFAESGNGRAAARAPAAPPTDEGILVTDIAHQRLRSAPPNEELEERIPVRGVRKAVAQKMTLSRQEIPEATTWVDCDATGLWELREDLKAANPGTKITPLALVMRIVVAGIRRFPEVNARLDTETNEIVLQHFVNLGFAAQTGRGLMVPVVKRADTMPILELAAELDRLAEGARAGKLTPEELTGGTFTISNYGSFGVDGGSAVINHPEAAILGVGRIVDKPWVVDGELAVRKVMQLSIAFDHRICDGGEAAGFLRFVGDCVENPAVLIGSL